MTMCIQVISSGANCFGRICCPYYRDLKGLWGQWLCVGFNCVCMYLCVWERRVTVGMCFACVEWVVCIWVGLFVCVRCKMEESRLSHWCCIGNGCWITEREGGREEGKPTHCLSITDSKKHDKKPAGYAREERVTWCCGVRVFGWSDQMRHDDDALFDGYFSEQLWWWRLIAPYHWAVCASELI